MLDLLVYSEFYEVESKRPPYVIISIPTHKVNFTEKRRKIKAFKIAY